MTDKNEDMAGVFLGGGALDHVVSGGEVYLHLSQLAALLGQTGASVGVQAILTNDPVNGSLAHALLMISEKMEDLRSELLKREIEASFSAEFPDTE